MLLYFLIPGPLQAGGFVCAGAEATTPYDIQGMCAFDLQSVHRTHTNNRNRQRQFLWGHVQSMPLMDTHTHVVVLCLFGSREYNE